jgi:ribosomal-protein-alanine N-acetyltransferase
LETERLTLVALTLDVVAALGEGAGAEQLVGAAIPEGWPDDELLGLLSLYRDWLRADPSVLGFGPWLVIVRDEGVVAGSAGFVGKPSAEGSIELGFGIHPAYRNRGYASEAARALVEWGLDQPGVQRVIARCDVDNHPSIRVLEKTKLARLGEEDGQLVWAMT